jgi:putative ABC transport system permease protein
MDALLHDLRYAVRSLRRSAGFTFVAVLTLALGIGATTAVFSVIDGVLLRPLPFADEGRLFYFLEQSAEGGRRLPSYPNFLDWERDATTTDLAYARGRREAMRGTDGVENVLVAYVSPRFLSVLGARPILGRTLLPDEEREGAGNAAVITHHFWMRHFGGDPAAVGKTLVLGDRSYTVVGVMPREAAFPLWVDIWAPVAAIAGTDRVLEERDFHADGILIGRLRRGVPLPQAQSELGTIAQRLATAYPAANRDWTSVNAQPLGSAIIGDVKPRLLVLMGAVAVVLLIACANVTSLSLARAAARTREIAIRSALGAGRARVVRQLLTESVLIAAAGGVLGAVIGWSGVALLRHAAPWAVPRLGEVTLDFRVLAFVLVVSLATALIVGLVPAWRSVVPDLADSLRERAHGAGGGALRQRLRATLVTVEIALALMLVTGAGLLMRSFQELQQLELGFDPERMVTFDITPPSPRYDDPRDAAALYARVADAVRPIPGVERVALANFPPGSGGIPTRVEVDGKVPYGEWGDRGASFRTISRGYFRAAGIPLHEGRDFTDAEIASAGAVAVVSKAFARLYWPGVSPLGHSVTVFKSAQGRADFGEPIQITVVGVAGDVQNGAPGDPPRPEIYVPFTTNPWTHMNLVVRATGEPAALIPELKRAVLGVEPAIPIAGGGADFIVMDEQNARGLGAQPRDVLSLVVRQGMMLAVIGIALGVAGAFAVTRLLASMLYGVAPTDPATFASVAGLLGAVALLACWLPARRAARVDPNVALRSE